MIFHGVCLLNLISLFDLITSSQILTSTTLPCLSPEILQNFIQPSLLNPGDIQHLYQSLGQPFNDKKDVWIEYNYVEIRPRVNISLITPTTIVKPYQVMEFELRQMVNPTPDDRRLQIHPYLNGSNILYNIYLFGEGEDIGHLRQAQRCTDLVITTYARCVDVTCEDKIFNSAEVLSTCGKKIMTYLFEGPKRTFIC